MSNNTIDVALIQELVQGTIIANYISFATLAVLVYDASSSLHFCNALLY